MLIAGENRPLLSKYAPNLKGPNLLVKMTYLYCFQTLLLIPYQLRGN